MEDEIEYLLQCAVCDDVIYCPKCGTTLEPDCPVCGECGWKNTLIGGGFI